MIHVLTVLNMHLTIENIFFFNEMMIIIKFDLKIEKCYHCLMGVQNYKYVHDDPTILIGSTYIYF